MTKGEVQTAVQLAWLQVLADTNLDPETLTDFDKMLFTIAFTRGMDAAMEKVKKTLQEGA